MLNIQHKHDVEYSRRQIYAYHLSAYSALLHRFVSVPIC